MPHAGRGWPAPLTFAVLAVAGCTVGPRFERPPPPAATRYTTAPVPRVVGGGGAAQRFLPGGAVASNWWTFFGSRDLDALEDEALRNNNDLAAAEAALRQAREVYLSERAATLPSVAFAGGAQGAKNSAAIAPPLANNSEYYTLYQGQLNLSYTVDVFGGVRRQLESDAAVLENQRFQTEAAYLTLTTNVAGATLQIAGLTDQIAAAERAVLADRRAIDLLRQQQRLGEASALDVATAQSTLEQAEQQAPPLRKQLMMERDMLAALLGRPGEDAPAARFELAAFALPRELPVSLPAALVRQRPDILAAEANLHSASALVGVAIAARLPSFTLGASAGQASVSIPGLLSASNSLWSVTGDIAQTVFDAGALRHKQKAAEAALEEAKAQYRSAVVDGLQNVADVLQSIEADGLAEQHAEAAEAAAARTLALSRDQDSAGEAGRLPVLAAEASEAQASQTLAQTHAARYADTVALFQALGGGWWNGAQPAPTAAP